jgi:hypothetical protein
LPSTSRLLRQRIDAELATDADGIDPRWRERFALPDPDHYAEKPTLHLRCSREFRAALDRAIAVSGQATMSEFVIDAVGAKMAAVSDVVLSELPEFTPEPIRFQR